MQEYNSDGAADSSSRPLSAFGTVGLTTQYLRWRHSPSTTAYKFSSRTARTRFVSIMLLPRPDWRPRFVSGRLLRAGGLIFPLPAEQIDNRCLFLTFRNDRVIFRKNSCRVDVMPFDLPCFPHVEFPLGEPIVPINSGAETPVPATACVRRYSPNESYALRNVVRLSLVEGVIVFIRKVRKANLLSVSEARKAGSFPIKIRYSCGLLLLMPRIIVTRSFSSTS